MKAKKTTKTTKRKGRITAIANQKGGVGKTTTAHALVTGLTLKGYKALAVDIDPQSNLTYTMGASSELPGTYELMAAEAGQEDAAASDVIQRTEQGDIISSSLMLAGADMEFTEPGREYILSEILNPLRAIYDYIVIDCPPTLGILTVNALTAADDLIVPLGADAYSVQGFSQLHTTIGKIRKRCNTGLKIAGILITRHSGRTALGRDLKEVIEEKAKLVGTKTFKTFIRESVAIKEAQLEQKNIYSIAKNKAVADYQSFVEEYLKGAKNG